MSSNASPSPYLAFDQSKEKNGARRPTRFDIGHGLISRFNADVFAVVFTRAPEEVHSPMHPSIHSGPGAGNYSPPRSICPSFVRLSGTLRWYGRSPDRHPGRYQGHERSAARQQPPLLSPVNPSPQPSPFQTVLRDEATHGRRFREENAAPTLPASSQTGWLDISTKAILTFWRGACVPS